MLRTAIGLELEGRLTSSSRGTSLAQPLSVAAAVLVIAVYAVHHSGTVRLMFHELRMNDFGKFYYSARQFLDGGAMYPLAPVEEAGDAAWHVYGFVNTNPPHFHLPILALARLPPAVALTVWTAGGMAALFLSLALMVRELRLRIAPAQALWLAAGVIALAAMEAVLITGQLSLWLMLAMTLAWRHARRDNWLRAGAWLGVVASIKPFGLIFLPWLVLQRRSNAVVGFCSAALAAIVAGLVVFGWEAHAAWIRALQSLNWPWAAMNASLLGAWSRWLADTPFFAPAADAARLVQPLWLLSAALVGLLTMTAVARARGPAAVDRAFGLLMLSALLISPLGWVYYWWLAAPGTVAVLAVRRNAWFWLALPWLFAPLGLVVAIDDSGWATLSIGSAYLWGTLLLWTSLLAAGIAPRTLDHDFGITLEER